MKTLRPIFAAAGASVVSIIVTTVVTIWAELSAPFKAFLTNYTGHHWVTKSFLSVIVFAACFTICWLAGSHVAAPRTKKALIALEIVVLVCSVVLLGFFIYEFVKA